MTIRLTQIDGKLPNLALMKLAHHFRQKGDDVYFTKHVERDMLEPQYSSVYGSAIFSYSAERVELFKRNFPEAIVGGTYNILDNTTVEQVLGIEENEQYDYSIYPHFTGSIGFTQRGCRLKCGFCLIPDIQIITADGLKPIVDIKVGDLVLTHLGRYRRVTEILSRPYQGKVLQLRSGAISELFPTIVTPEHPIYTRRVSYRSGGQKLTSFNWREAGELEPGHQQRETAVAEDRPVAGAFGSDSRGNPVRPVLRAIHR